MTITRQSKEVDAAFKFRNRLYLKKAIQTKSTLAVGAELCLFEESGLWEHLPDPTTNEGYESFDKWLRDDPVMNYSTDRTMMQAYRLWHETFFIPLPDLYKIDPSKFSDLNPVGETLAEQMANNADRVLQIDDEAREWVAFAQSASRSEIQARRNIEKRGYVRVKANISTDEIPERVRGEFDPDRPVKAIYHQRVAEEGE